MPGMVRLQTVFPCTTSKAFRNFSHARIRLKIISVYLTIVLIVMSFVISCWNRCIVVITLSQFSLDNYEDLRILVNAYSSSKVTIKLQCFAFDLATKIYSERIIKSFPVYIAKLPGS